LTRWFILTVRLALIPTDARRRRGPQRSDAIWRYLTAFPGRPAGR
jgi:hypothetical protein